MYNQLLSYLAALLIFTLQQPGPSATLSLPSTMLLGGGLFLAFCFVSIRSHLTLLRAIAREESLSWITHRYHRLQTRLSLIALGLLGVDAFVLNIKFYLNAIPGFAQSITLSGTAGILLYLLHQAVIWYCGYPIYRYIHRSQMTRRAFIRGHLSFNGALLVPWLLISLVSDLIENFDRIAFLKTPAGEYTTFALSLLLFVLFAPWLMVQLWRCEPLPASDKRAELEAFCRSQHFSLGDFKIWPLFGGETLTAGIVGVLPRLRYILITQGLLSLLTAEELKAVVAHEMGHARRLHLPFFLVFFLGYASLVYAYNDILVAFLLKQDLFLRWFLSGDANHLSLFSLAYSLPILLFFLVYFRFVFGFFLRNAERQADLYALELIGHPYTLISSLEKIALFSGQSHDLPNWHHFSIRERVTFLMDCHEHPHVSRSHHRKLYGTAILVACVLGILVWGGSALKRTGLLEDWRKEIEVKLVERKLLASPNDPRVAGSFGGLLLELGRYGDAERWLTKAHEALPDDPTILNNLAWFYATSPVPYFNPKAALPLAEAAAQADPAPNVLDTLAEAYHVNGRNEEALRAINEALTKNPSDRDYYLEQKKKFEEALQKKRP